MSESRTKILNAASELFLEGGASALSVRAIASRAGLSTIGIYSHFQGKQGILDTLYIEGFNMVYEASNVVTDDKVKIEDVLRAAQSYLTVAQDHEAHYRLIFGESGMDYEPSEEARKVSERAFGQLVKLVGDYIRDAGLNADPMQSSMTLWALLHGYVSIAHHAQAEDDWQYQPMALDAVETHLKALSIKAK